jgi:hypothetical protein
LNLSLVLHLPVKVSVIHSAVNTFKAYLIVTVKLEKYALKKAGVLYKAYLADPSKVARSALPSVCMLLPGQGGHYPDGWLRPD